MIRSIEGCNFASTLDFNMGYYHINLDADAQDLCTIIFSCPMEKIQIQRLTNGYQDYSDPDVFHNNMSKLVQDMEYVKTSMIS
jgi:hypothetical protein